MKHLILIGTVFLNSCSLFQVREDPRALSYKLGKLPSDWAQSGESKPAGTDHVFENKKSQAMISVNSVCGRYPTATLQSLTSQLSAALTAPDVIEERDLVVDGRDAFARRVRGKVDGVDVETFAAVVRKNNCIFDFVLLKSGLLSSTETEAFLKFLGEFRYE